MFKGDRDMPFRTVSLFVALLFVATPAAAEWRLAGQDDFSTIYYDPASRRALADGVVLLRALTDYNPNSPQAEPFKLSQKGLSEIETAVFDCAKAAYRSEGGGWFAGHMATGSVRSDYPGKTAWSKVPSYYTDLFAKACARD
jgi:hypothetical protein